MVQALGDVGYRATPLGVVAGLGGDDVTKNAGAAGNGSTGVVETGFDREDVWLLHGWYYTLRGTRLNSTHTVLVCERLTSG